MQVAIDEFIQVSLDLIQDVADPFPEAVVGNQRQRRNMGRAVVAHLEGRIWRIKQLTIQLV